MPGIWKPMCAMAGDLIVFLSCLMDFMCCAQVVKDVFVGIKVDDAGQGIVVVVGGSWRSWR